MTKKKQILDPNAKADFNDGIFGLSFSEEDARVVFLPVPWDVTTSYQEGTSRGPRAILKASAQIDFYDLDYSNAYEAGFHMKKENSKIKSDNKKGRALAKKIIASNNLMAKNLKEVNALCESLNETVYKETKSLLNKNKIPVVVGGDHATPFGAIQAYAEKYLDLGILHLDAHSDTRKSYMGFENSHASIMYNVIEKIPQIKKLVQVGIRDFCEEEFLYTQKNKKIEIYYDQHLLEKKMNGEPFKKIAHEIISHLPNHVYLSFDIDGLEPRYCPHTGTPVPGGLDYSEALFLVNEIVKSGRKLVGFDLVEVAPSKNKNDEWDANVGMRLLYKIASASLASLGYIKKIKE